ncbi:MAG: phage tail protein [Pseudonocardiaceae bacterium]
MANGSAAIRPGTEDPAVSVRFAVKLDSMELGEFNSCEGLGCEVVIEQREEGGNNGFVWQLPTRIKYPNIKLSRPLTKKTETVAKWFAQAVQGSGARTAEGTKTGEIRALTGDGDVVAIWELLDVVPVRWTGPSLNLESPKVATETIEIAHHGFKA